MIVPRLHMADMPDPDEDDRPIIRLLRKQVRERLAQIDAESGPGLDLENEARVRLIVHEVVDAHQRLALTTTNTPRLVDGDAAEKELISDQLGAGPLQIFLEDPNVEEIGVNGVDRVWLWTVDGRKVLVQEPLFESDEEIVELVRRLIRRLQRQFNIASPMVDAALPSGARLNAVLSGTSLLGTTVTIRKFPRRYRHLAEIVRTGALNWPCAKFLLACVAARANILIAGGMGTGKSTLMDVLLCDGIASPLERIVLISETHDLSAEQVLPDCVVLQARPPNADHQGEIKQSELFRTSLRMRASRVCVEEVRGPEAWQMLRAFASGHPGGLCTIHSETHPSGARGSRSTRRRRRTTSVRSTSPSGSPTVYTSSSSSASTPAVLDSRGSSRSPKSMDSKVPRLASRRSGSVTNRASLFGPACDRK
jgi:pilus assembly protein CpaF